MSVRRVRKWTYRVRAHVKGGRTWKRCRGLGQPQKHERGREHSLGGEILNKKGIISMSTGKRHTRFVSPLR